MYTCRFDYKYTEHFRRYSLIKSLIRRTLRLTLVNVFRRLQVSKRLRRNPNLVDHPHADRLSGEAKTFATCYPLSSP